MLQYFNIDAKESMFLLFVIKSDTNLKVHTLIKVSIFILSLVFVNFWF